MLESIWLLIFLIVKFAVYSFNQVDCSAGTFNVLGDSICQPCPLTGAICPGGSTVLVEEGYWQDKASLALGTPKIYRCPINTCCSSHLGCDTSTMCINGTGSNLCYSCLQPDTFLWGNSCLSCTSINISYFAAIFVIVAICLVLIIVCSSHETLLLANMIFAYQMMGLLIQPKEMIFPFVSIFTYFSPAIALQILGSSKCLAPLSGNFI